MKIPLGQRLLIWFFKCVNAVIPWHRLPKYIGAFNLLALRYELRANNLHDTYPSWDDQGNAQSEPLLDTKDLCVRNSDGKFNDLERPRMGCAGMRFGRNVPRQYTQAPSYEELMSPNPRIISERLLARQPGTFKPAAIVNLLAAAWIQFQVHDWLEHFKSAKQHEIPLPAGDKWPEDPMKIHKTQPDEILGDEDTDHPGYQNQNSKLNRVARS
jgi:Animal haem peroxidase